MEGGASRLTHDISLGTLVIKASMGGKGFGGVLRGVREHLYSNGRSIAAYEYEGEQKDFIQRGKKCYR